MNTNEYRLSEMIAKGEGIDLEFKTCRTQLNRDVYETVCAFLNRHGGTILLGVQDRGDVQGINPDAVAQIKKDFVTAVNNPQKITPPAYLSVNEVIFQGRTILHIHVQESSQVHRCNGRIYDRNEDGDLDITNHTVQVANLYQRKQSMFTENKLYPLIKLDDLRIDLIEKCRKIARVNTPGHPWAGLDDIQLIKSAQLYQTDPLTQKSGVTLAGILLLGTDQLILSVVPAHRTDLILRKFNVDRYDDRDLVRTNLIDSYDRIVAFVQKHLPDPFYLDGMERVSLRDTIFREVASNMLIHREYINASPARLIIEYGQVRTENANRPHGFGLLNLATAAPYPKNPVIGAFFREIHRADELGSGMRKMMRYGKVYGGDDPEMIEEDTFRMVIKIPEFGGRVSTEIAGEVKAQGEPHEVLGGVNEYTQQVTQQVTHQVTQQVIRLLKTISGEMARAEIMAELSLNDRVNFSRNYLEPALSYGLIEMTIPDKPKSSNQKYRLTQAGKHLFETLKKIP